MRGTLFLAAIAVALSACGPHLTQQLRVERSYLPSADCAQGPFTLKVPVLGTKWGEEIELEAQGRPIEGWAKASTAGISDYDHYFKQWSSYAVVDNSRCKLAPTSSAGMGPSLGDVWARPDFAAPKPVAAAAAPVKEAPVELVPTEHPPEVMVNGRGYYSIKTTMVSITFGVDRVGAVPLQKDGYWVITFWNTTPLDLSDVVFVLRQHELVPSVPEQEWVAYLEKQKADEEADRAKRRHESEERQREYDEKYAAERKHQEECMRHLGSSDCEDVKADLEANALYQKQQDEQRQHDLFCKTHLDDGTCFEYRRVAEYRKQEQRLNECRPHSNDPSCADVREKLKVATPSGPPPVARAEEQPPRPSEHAEWVPGSWVWDGFEYQWTGGGWRVPDSDIQARLTVQAPAPPPEPRVEAAPVQRPVFGAVWVPGAWYWNGGGWVWIAGNWRMPPQAGLRWRPPVWVLSSRGVQLDPGRWVR